MTSRGLPGFLRRSRRNNSYDDDDDDENDSSGNNNNDIPLSVQAIQKQTTSVTVEEATATTRPSPREPVTTAAITQNVEEDVASIHLASSSQEDEGESRPESQRSLSSLEDSMSTTPSGRLHRTTPNSSRTSSSYRGTQFDNVLSAEIVKLAELRKLGWNGIPPAQRGMAWKLLLGYLPTNPQRRQQTLERKRAEYKDAIRQHYEIDDNSRTVQEQETLRQVLVDVPRTAPDIPLFRNERIRRALARLLYIWAIRHPASSYVQGINDLATPLFAVFLSEYYNNEDCLDGNVMVVIAEERLEEVEADVYWSLNNILAGIQDHYTADQPGVQRMVMRLEELVQRIDSNLCDHLQETGIQFMQFAFKWMNCLLLREFNLRCVIRLWDTYISEETPNGFEDFHVYVCAAFLCQFSLQLQEMDFETLFQFMQDVPTEDWTETEIEMLLSQAFVLSTLFGGSEAHLTAPNKR